jgi:rRNA maturation RNase YbeY
MTPEIHFAENNGVNIAYQVFGSGSRDLIIIPGWLSNLDIFWEEPRAARFFRALGEFSRVILIDKRGTGLSDRVPPPTLEVQMDDVKAVMEAADSRKASFLGYSEGGAMSMLFAATYPDRTSSLILIGCTSKELPDDLSLEEFAESYNSWLGYGAEAIDKHFYIDKKPIVLNVSICSDEEIIEINSEHRNKDKVTDVLSFPMQESMRNGEFEDFLPEIELGDILICKSVCEKQAIEFDLSYFEEFIHLFVHGFLHVYGYDHEISEDEEKIMESLEVSILMKVSEIKKAGTSPA